jgi:hypothetical protein
MVHIESINTNVTTPLVYTRKVLSTITKVTAMLAVFVLISCASPEPFISGDMVQSPYGWVQYCTNHISDLDCKGITK